MTSRQPSPKRVIEPALLRDTEAAAYLGVSLAALKQLTQERLLPVVILRKGLRRDLRRWSRTSLDRVISQRERGEGPLSQMAERRRPAAMLLTRERAAVSVRARPRSGSRRRDHTEDR